MVPLLRSIFWRWRDAVFDGPFRRSLGRTKFAEPSRDTALRVYPPLEQEAPIHRPHHLAEPSRDRALRFHSIAEARGDHPPPIRRFEKSWRRGILLPLVTAPLLCVNL